jgi:phosphoenolpyruvate-protein kinase (PTS system EI component)
MGLDEFSVIPSVLPEIKKIIRSIRFRDAKRTAERVLGLATETEIRTVLAEAIHTSLPDLPLED